MGKDLGKLVLSFLKDSLDDEANLLYAREKRKTEWKNMNSRGDKSDLNGSENNQRALYINVFAYISYIRKMRAINAAIGSTRKNAACCKNK